MAWVTLCHPCGEETGGSEAGLGDFQGVGNDASCLAHIEFKMSVRPLEGNVQEKSGL